MKFKWRSVENEIETYLHDRDMTIEYLSTGWHDEGRFSGRIDDCYPPEGNSSVHGIIVSWQSEKLAFTIKQNDRNWKRMENMCPLFISSVIDECEQDDESKYPRSEQND